MYLDKALIVVGLFAAVGSDCWPGTSSQSGAKQAADAAPPPGRRGRREAASGSRQLMTRADVDDALDGYRNLALHTLVMARGVRDEVIAIRSSQPDLKPIEHFLRFSGAYRELLLEELARRARVDLGATRAAVEKMFEGQGGKPPGWFWGPVPAAP